MSAGHPAVETSAGGMDTFASRFDPRANAFNALRLFLAAMVVVQHAALTGGYQLAEPLYVLFGELAVDGFFVISGFLLARSWLRRPLWGRYLWHRFVRIFPAFWVCLLVTAFVIAPLAAAVQGLSWSAFWSEPNGPLGYVWRNSLLWIQQTAISSTPAGVPLPYEWNASLWTLYWEFLCYLVLLVLGVWGVLRRTPYVVIWLAGLLWLVFVVQAFHDDFDTWVNTSFTALVLPRLGLMFLLGAAFFLFARYVPVSGVIAAAAGAFVIAALAGPYDFRLIGALPLAYLVLWFGVRAPIRWGLRHDLSYGLYIYAFPMQQILVIAGVSFGWIASAVLAVLMTLPLAAFSWFVVERPMLRRKNWTPGQPTRVDAGEPPAAQGGVTQGDLLTAVEETPDATRWSLKLGPALFVLALGGLWFAMHLML
jgi:peptidoglycan/LPS O-acetylase OafA/YrhL